MNLHDSTKQQLKPDASCQEADVMSLTSLYGPIHWVGVRGLHLLFDSLSRAD